MIKVNYRALGMLSTNCYVVENPDSQKVLIVDPGDSPLEKKSSTCWGIQRKIFPGSGANRTRCRRTKP